MVISTFSGCNDDDNYNTSHPEEGGVTLTMDWSKAESPIPSTYHAYITSPSGKNRFFENLSGTTNNLVVEPGKAMLYVYNEAEHISVSEKKAIIDNIGGDIPSNPGLFYLYSGEIHTERDQDLPQTAVMNRQTGELKITIAIKPAAMIDKVKTIKAVLGGIASELDMQTNDLSIPAVTSFSFYKSSYYATAVIRTLGFPSSAKQNLKLDIEFENGNTTSITNDLTSLLDGFNTSKNRLFTLNTSMFINETTLSVTIDNWECNTESRYLSAFPLEISLPYIASDESIIITTDLPSWEYSIIKTGDWLTITKTATQLNLSATQNTENNARQATIHLSAGSMNESITITQHAYENEDYSDKEVIKLQSATIGNGVNIVLMGDGYTTKDMTKRTGKYERDMRAATEHFFSVYPYTAYRDYFNVYMITALSNEEGLSNKSTHTFVDTKFESVWEGTGSTAINCNMSRVVEYVDAITELVNTDINDLTVIMPINAYIYAGTCAMYYFGNDMTNFGNGFSISMCPVGAYFEEVIVHEAAGHGFAKVTDEYIYYPTATIPDEEIEQTRLFKTLGWCENVDFHSNITQTSWSSFANILKYSMVDTFEGADMYGKGIWRPEYNSCMNNNIPYFNAPTRWAQVRRIKKLAGFDYSITQFLQEDVIPEYPVETRRRENFRPLAPPVMKIIADN